MRHILIKPERRKQEISLRGIESLSPVWDNLNQVAERRVRLRRRHFVLASLSWITENSRGGWSLFASGERIYFPRPYRSQLGGTGVYFPSVSSAFGQ